MNTEKWNKVYAEQDSTNIPWNFEEVPAWFQEIIESGWVKPCKTIDVGCGLGSYAHYLATKKFDVLGIDLSREAINRNLAKYQHPLLRFKVANAFGLKACCQKFGFIVDISLFHHIHPADRFDYRQALVAVSKPGTKVLLCCFSRADPLFEGKTYFYGPDTETITYVLSEKEIRETFEDHFVIEEIKELSYGKPAKFKDSVIRKRHLVKMTRM